jgi:NAD(P)-dependent dehydrogenase (short-subunit alcohol dehydrogenase family)
VQTLLITGANRGLGLAHTRKFLERGNRVLALVREPQAAADLHALAPHFGAALEVLAYDALDPQAPARIKQSLGNTAIDVLFANAGANGAKREAFGAVDPEAVLALVRINALAPLALAEALKDNVLASQRKLVAFQSSLMGSIGDNASGGHYAYRIAKAALNMVTKNVALDLFAEGAIVVALHPGWVQTRMGGANAPLTQEQSVSGQQQLLERLTLQDSGGFFNYDGKPLPW